jgi:hypothetical protein
MVTSRQPRKAGPQMKDTYAILRSNLNNKFKYYLLMYPQYLAQCLVWNQGSTGVAHWLRNHTDTQESD